MLKNGWDLLDHMELYSQVHLTNGLMNQADWVNDFWIVIVIE